jgi:hypothetical protein
MQGIAETELLGIRPGSRGALLSERFNRGGRELSAKASILKAKITQSPDPSFPASS